MHICTNIPYEKRDALDRCQLTKYMQVIFDCIQMGSRCDARQRQVIEDHQRRFLKRLCLDLMTGTASFPRCPLLGQPRRIYAGPTVRKMTQASRWPAYRLPTTLLCSFHLYPGCPEINAWSQDENRSHHRESPINILDRMGLAWSKRSESKETTGRDEIFPVVRRRCTEQMTHLPCELITHSAQAEQVQEQHKSFCCLVASSLLISLKPKTVIQLSCSPLSHKLGKSWPVWFCETPLEATICMSHSMR